MITYKESVVGITVFLLALAAFTVGLRYMAYSNPDEKRYIQSAQEMSESADWITPRFHGQPRYQKPILFYWLSAGSAKAFGGAWAARIPSAICGALTVAFVYLISVLVYGRPAGVFSAALLCVSGIFFIFARLATPDITMLFFITLSIYLYMKIIIKRPSVALACSFFAALALATLTKGLAGLFIPLISIGLFVLIYKEKNGLRKTDLFLGIPLFFIITLPWFLAMYAAHGMEYINHIWRIETVARARDVVLCRGCFITEFFKRFLRYSLLTIAMFMPATIFLPSAMAGKLRRRQGQRGEPLLFIWAFTVIIFFSAVGTKKTHYILPAAPPLAIMMGGYLSGITTANKRLARALGVFLISCLFIFMAVFGYVVPHLNMGNGLIRLSEKIVSLRCDDEEVGVGSHFISHNRLAYYLDSKVEKVNVDLYDPDEEYAVSRHILKNFLGRDKRVFCVILREDYDKYIPKNLERKVFLIDVAWYWKKPNQISFDRELFAHLITMDKNALREDLKNEIYLISNSP